MKQLFLLFAFSLSAIYGFSQSEMVATGGDAKSKTGSISSSIGQVVTLQVTNEIGSISQGVQVPYLISTVGIDKYPTISVTMAVFPNPTVSGVSLEIQNFEELTGCRAELFDGNSHMLQTIEITDSQTYIQLQNYVAGIYFLNVYNKNNVLKNFKIVKQ